MTGVSTIASTSPTSDSEVSRPINAAIAGAEVSDLAGLYRKVWSLGPAGLEIPMSIYRDGKTIETRIKSGDRTRFLKTPKLH